MFYGIANPSDTFYFPVGVLWFLFTLFWVEILFQVINLIFPSKYNLSVSFLSGTLGIFLTQLTKDGLPQNFDLVLICLVYYHLGFIAKLFYFSFKENWKESYNNLLLALTSIAFILWLYFTLDEGVSLVLSLGVINIKSLFVSLLASYYIIIFCIAILNNNFTRRVLGRIGKNTLLILIIHHFDEMFPIWYVNNIYLSGILRLSIDILLAFILLYFINKIRKLLILIKH